MNVGGPALQCTALTEDLDTARFDSLLLTGSVAEGEADYIDLRAPDLPHKRVPGLGRSVRAGGDARAIAAIVAEMHRFRPHIVHTHTAKAGVLGRVAARIERVPLTVHTFHGHLLHGYFGPVAETAVATVERTLARDTTALVAVGSRVRDDLLAARIGRPDQFTVVPPGVQMPPGPPAEEARRSLGLPETGPVVAFVARLTDIKRPDRMLEVAARVASATPHATFVVVGAGPLLHSMREQVVARSLPVVFAGWRSDVETVYAAADIALLTSDNEGMPVSLIEASAAGVPCVTTDVGSAGEVVLHGETGFVVQESVAALSEAIIRLIRDSNKRQRMGAAAAAHASRAFGRQRLVTDIELLYDHIIATSGLSYRRW